LSETKTRESKEEIVGACLADAIGDRFEREVPSIRQSPSVRTDQDKNWEDEQKRSGDERGHPYAGRRRLQALRRHAKNGEEQADATVDNNGRYHLRRLLCFATTSTRRYTSPSYDQSRRLHRRVNSEE
jgi:hypothetical protein